MKISLNWLTDYVDVSAVPARDLAAALTRAGIGCDSIAETPSDVVLELEITSNRPDCLGHIGVAREVSAVLKLPLKLPDLSKIPTGSKDAAKLTGVQVLDPELCPRYTARVIAGVKVGPSPAWMVERLEAVGLRSINNVVDVTNYVLMEYGQPLHAFDYDRLAEHRIVVRRAKPGEEIVSIDGTRCALTGGMLVIADAAKPVAVAGVMGGLESEISASSNTVLLESAQFDPLTTRKTARALMLISESSYRFERGVDPVGVEAASLRACQLILQAAGGELAQGVVDVWANPHRPVQVSLRTARCRALLGAEIDAAAQAGILDRLGLSPKVSGDRIDCTIPSYRADLTREVDLIEEVARLHGLDKIPVRTRVSHAVVPAGRVELARRRAREALSAAGIDEAVTFSFVDDPEATMFGFAAQVRVDAVVRRTNNLLRPALLPSLLRACKGNQDVGNEDVCLYELAAVFPPGGDGSGRPAEHVSLGVVCRRDVRFVRGVLEAVAAAVAPLAKVEVVPGSVAGLDSGASAEVRLDGQAVGILGVVDQAVLDYYGLEKPHAAGAINFDELVKRIGRERVYQPLARFPAVRRDLSLVVDEAATWRQVTETVARTDQPALEELTYVGSYRGKQVPAGKKSVTLSLTYRLPDRTLRHDEVDEMIAAVVSALDKALGAKLRQ